MRPKSKRSRPLLINTATARLIIAYVRGFKSAEVAKILENDFDILVRSDFHCSPFIHKYIKSIDYLGTVRVSFSYFNTIKECDRLISALEEIIYEF